MEPTEKKFSDYLAIFRRRRKNLIVTFTIFLLIAVGIAFGLPPKYVSQATILIEEQEVPEDLVPSTVNTYADQQIQTISQRVMTTENLSNIIKKFNLYADKRDSEPLDKIIDDMRNDIELNTVSADVVDPKTGKSTTTTIAFTISYENKSPDLAQRVTNDLVSLFLNENLKDRTQIASGTSSFLSNEAKKIKKNLDDLDKNIAAFKEKNLGKLPDMVAVNMQLMSKAQDEVTDIERQIMSLTDRKTYLEGQLAQISPTTKLYDQKGQRILGPADRLAQLEVDYAEAAAKYSPDHPDVVTLKKQIEVLKKQVGSGDIKSGLQGELQKLRADLAEAQKKYAPDHPDVKRLTKDIVILEKELAAVPPATSNAGDADNPAYVQLSANLQSTDAELQSLFRQQKATRKKIFDYEEKINDAPQVEKTYNELMRDYTVTQAKYQDISNKQMAAQVAQTMESQRKGERFTLIEPPQLPETPDKPNRPVILVLGFLFSGAMGVGAVAFAEAVDDAIYGRSGVAALLGVPPLAVIPYIETVADRRNRLLRRILILISLIVGVVLILAAINYFFMPLDVLWYTLLQRSGIWSYSSQLSN